MSDIRVGDIVARSAKGKLWRVTGFWQPAVGEGQFASLEPLVGYTSASHPVDQLRLVQRDGGEES